MKRIRSTRIILGDKVVEGVIEIQDGIIVGILPYVSDFDIDYKDCIIAPGLIDIHNHGYAGWSFTNTSSETDIESLLKRMVSEGITSMLATSSPQAFSTINRFIKQPTGYTEILGYHYEGPFLNNEQHGAASPETRYLEPSLEKLNRWHKDSLHQVRMMTLAPEINGNHEVMDWLKEHGIKVAVGHSNASYFELEPIKESIDIMTHLGNAMAGIHHRDIGVLGFGLHEKVKVEVIADGHHVSKEMLDLIFRLKSVDEIVLVSDTIALGGCAEGRYDTSHGTVWMTKEGRLVNEHNRLSGSSKTLMEDVRYLHETFNFTLHELFKMASLNPAEFLGYRDRGEIDINKQADLLILDDNLVLLKVYKKGNIVYQQGDSKMNNQEHVHVMLKDPEYLNFYGLEYQ